RSTARTSGSGRRSSGSALGLDGRRHGTAEVGCASWGRGLGVVSGEGNHPGGGNMARSGSQAAWDPWTYRGDVGGDRGDLVGYDVGATERHVDKLEEASHDVRARAAV